MDVYTKHAVTRVRQSKKHFLPIKLLRQAGNAWVFNGCVMTQRVAERSRLTLTGT